MVFAAVISDDDAKLVALAVTAMDVGLLEPVAVGRVDEVGRLIASPDLRL